MNKQEQREAINKRVEDIRKTTNDVDRWRKIRDLTINLNKANMAEHKAVVKQVKEARDELKNDFAVGEDSGMRYALSFPTAVYDALLAFGEDILKPYQNPEEGRKHTQKVAKAFPEYRVMRRI